MVLYVVGAHGEKSAETNVESKVFNDNTFFAKAVQQIIGHIEAGGWRRGGAHIPRPDSLVAFFVIFCSITVKIGRQGNSAVFFG